MLKPKEVKRLGYHGVEIEWQDSITHTLTNTVLRENCPSASSLAKRGDSSHDKPLSGKKRLMVVKSSKIEELKLEQIWLVGNYALGMRWGDGHDSGIYTFEYLRELGEKYGQFDPHADQSERESR